MNQLFSPAECLKRIGLHKSRCTIVAVIDRFYVSAQNLSDTGRPHVGVNKDLHRDTHTQTQRHHYLYIQIYAIQENRTTDIIVFISESEKKESLALSHI